MRAYLYQTTWLVAIDLILLTGCKPRDPARITDTIKKNCGEALPTTQSVVIVERSVDITPVRDYRSIFITSNTFAENLGMESSLTLNKTKLYVLPELFCHTNACRIDELFEGLAIGDAKYGFTVTGRLFRVASRAIRYRALLPYLRAALLTSDITNNLSRASLGINLLCSIPHADTLRIWQEIDAKIPTNSPLRAGSFPRWRAYQPLFMRNDCLEIYLDTVNHPERYERDTWWGAVEKVQYFTNDTAVAGLQFSLKVMKEPGKYWSGMKPSLYILSVEEMLKDQQEYVQGKRGMTPMDSEKPFDE